MLNQEASSSDLRKMTQQTIAQSPALLSLLGWINIPRLQERAALLRFEYGLAAFHGPHAILAGTAFMMTEDARLWGTPLPAWLENVAFTNSSHAQAFRRVN